MHLYIFSVVVLKIYRAGVDLDVAMMIDIAEIRRMVGAATHRHCLSAARGNTEPNGSRFGALIAS
jgi:hypothetical protein